MSTWIEATSHPQTNNPAEDTARYYVGLQTREDTLRYAEAAGALAICFRECRSCPRSKYEKWVGSAKWAFEWGMNETNQCRFNITKAKVEYDLTYVEPEVDDRTIARAALTMYNLTGDKEILDKYIYLNKTGTTIDKKYQSGIKNMIDKDRNYGAFEAFPLIYYIDNEDFAVATSYHSNRLKRNIQIIQTYQSDDNLNNTYRNAYFYPSNHPYYNSLGWGNYIGGPQIEYLVMGYFLRPNDRKAYLQSLAYYYDFQMGCNHQGRSLTTGLGHVYPIKFVSHPMWYLLTKKIVDPIPGITIYTFTGEIEMSAMIHQYLFNYDGREDFNFKGYKFVQSPMLVNDTVSPEYSTVRKIAYDYVPLWRRMANIEGDTIASSEFTVSETIVKMAIEAGILLEKDENVADCNASTCPSVMPTSEQKNIAPKKITYDTLGKWSIP